MNMAFSISSLAFWRKQGEVAVPGVVAEPTLGKRKWAVDITGQVGIINDLANGIAEFHQVDPAGETLLVLQIPVSQLRPARRLEIPESRRPDYVRGASLGYY
jgi:hypothetical protein